WRVGWATAISGAGREPKRSCTDIGIFSADKPEQDVGDHSRHNQDQDGSRRSKADIEEIEHLAVGIDADQLGGVAGAATGCDEHHIEHTEVVDHAEDN